MKRYALFAVGAPVAVWLAMVATGTRADTAGTRLTQRGFVLPIKFGLLIEAVAAGLVAARVTK